MTEYDYRDPHGYATPAEPYPTAEPYHPVDRYRSTDQPAEPYRPGPYRRPDPYRSADPYRPVDPYRAADPYQAADPYRAGDPYRFYPPYPYQAPEHPQGSTVLILGVLSVVFAPLGFVAWYLGSRAQREIAETGAVYSNTGNITAGKIVGMITSIMTIASGAFFVLYFAFIVIVMLGSRFN